jgi:hypothetical protein
MGSQRRRPRWLVLALVVAHPFVMSSMSAQERDPVAPAGPAFRVTPLFAVSQVYDSNLFSSAVSPKSDLVTRVSPGLEAEHRSSRATVFGRYVLDLDRFAGHPELTAADGRQQASVRLQARGSRRLGLFLDADFTRTHTPGELEVHPAIVRQIGPVMEGRLDYTWTDERLFGGVATRSHRADVQIERQVSRKDVVDAKYGVRTYDFTSGEPVISHVVAAGWSRQVTRQTSVEVRGGPVLTERRLAPEVFAVWRHQRRAADLSLTYARTQTTLIGFERTVDTESVAVSAAYRPTQRLQIRMAPAVYRTTSSGQRANAGRLTLEADLQMTSRLSVRTSYDGTLQRGALMPAPAGSIARHLVQVSLVVAAGRPRRGR